MSHPGLLLGGVSHPLTYAGGIGYQILAEFFAQKPFSTPPAEVAHHPGHL